MMSERLPIGSYVELKDGFEEVYPLAVAGSRGTIADNKVDGYGYKQVFVKWDKDHWRYNGETDGWTFENHFMPLASPDTTILNDEADVPVTLEAPCEHCGETHPEDTMSTADAFLNYLADAFDEAVDGEAYIVVSVRRELDEEGKEQLVPVVHAASLDDAATYTLETFLAHLATGTIMRNLKRRND